MTPKGKAHKKVYAWSRDAGACHITIVDGMNSHNVKKFVSLCMEIYTPSQVMHERPCDGVLCEDCLRAEQLRETMEGTINSAVDAHNERICSVRD